MKLQARSPKQPLQSEIQPLLQLLNAGRWTQAESACLALLRTYPNALVVHNLLGAALERLGRCADAADSYRKALAIDPGIAEIHFNLGVVLSNLGKVDQAEASYRRAIALKRDLAVAQFNLGALLQETDRLDEAIACYRNATAVEPGFLEAHTNLGTVLQRQGELDQAAASYRRALSIQPTAKGHFNLGTALRGQGKLDEAVASYRNALGIEPGYTEAHTNLGESLRDQGKIDEAVACYQRALSIEPNNAQASYDMAEFLALAGRYDEAIRHFEQSGLWDSPERALYCMYKAGRFTEFEGKLERALAGRHVSPLLATLSAHHAANFAVEDRYGFCKNPMDFVFHGTIDALVEPDSPLLRDLLRDITHTEIAERKQGRLYYGIQSAGNLLKRPESSLQTLAALIREKIAQYRQQFSGEDCELVRAFPVNLEFSSSWYLKMHKGGHLTSHIHEEGWISGCVYLAVPPRRGEHGGSIEFSTDGDDYPKRHENFPSRIVDQRVGDIVLFPSSLFHRTIPFEADEERVCIAFDLKPAVA